MTIHEYSAFVLINFDSFNNFPNLVSNFSLHVDVFYTGIGIPKKLCAVLPPFKSVAAIPDDAAATLLKGGRTAHSFFGIPIPV